MRIPENGAYQCPNGCAVGIVTMTNTDHPTPSGQRCPVCGVFLDPRFVLEATIIAHEQFVISLAKNSTRRDFTLSETDLIERSRENIHTVAKEIWKGQP